MTMLVTKSPPYKLNEDVIRILNETLEMAMNGEITDLAVCYVKANGLAGNNFSYSKNKAVSIIGALTITCRDIVDTTVTMRDQE